MKSGGRRLGSSTTPSCCQRTRVLLVLICAASAAGGAQSAVAGRAKCPGMTEELGKALKKKEEDEEEVAKKAGEACVVPPSEDEAAALLEVLPEQRLPYRRRTDVLFPPAPAPKKVNAAAGGNSTEQHADEDLLVRARAMMGLTGAGTEKGSSWEEDRDQARIRNAIQAALPTRSGKNERRRGGALRPLVDLLVPPGISQNSWMTVTEERDPLTAKWVHYYTVPLRLTGGVDEALPCSFADAIDGLDSQEEHPPGDPKGGGVQVKMRYTDFERLKEELESRLRERSAAASGMEDEASALTQEEEEQDEQLSTSFANVRSTFSEVWMPPSATAYAKAVKHRFNKKMADAKRPLAKSDPFTQGLKRILQAFPRRGFFWADQKVLESRRTQFSRLLNYLFLGSEEASQAAPELGIKPKQAQALGVLAEALPRAPSFPLGQPKWLEDRAEIYQCI